MTVFDLMNYKVNISAFNALVSPPKTMPGMGLEPMTIRYL